MRPRPPSWLRSSRVLRIVVIGVAVVVAYDLGAAGISRSTDDHADGAGSSFTIGDGGTAALAKLLSRNGHAVERRRDPLEHGSLDTGSTLFVLSPAEELDLQDEVLALRAFVLGGGRLVLGGRSVAPVVGSIGNAPPSITLRGRSEWTVAGGRLGAIGRISAQGLGAWDPVGGSDPLVDHADGRALLTVERVGDGEIYYLADISPLSNSSLGDDDNAAFALWLAGDDDRPVAFAESVHGYGPGTGLAAIPGRWKAALRILGLAALVFMWARGVRLGPPERRARPLPPPRRMHVDALAATLARAKPNLDVVTPLQEAARAQLAARGGLPPDAPAEELGRVATAAGLSDEEARALLEPAGDEAGVLAAGRALARLTSPPGPPATRRGAGEHKTETTT